MTAEEINAAGIDDARTMVEAALADRGYEEVVETVDSEAANGETHTGTCGSNMIWALNSYGVLGLSGSGAMDNWDSFMDTPWSAYADSITAISISPSVNITSIGDHAFEYCNGLTSVRITPSVVKIGYRAFANCGGLSSVTIQGNNVVIDDFAFGDCSNLQTVTIEGTLSSGTNTNDAFWNTPWLQNRCGHTNTHRGVLCLNCGKHLHNFFIQQPDNVTAAVGSTAQFTVQIASDAFSVEWYRVVQDGLTQIEGEASTTLRIPVTQDKNNSAYVCHVDYFNGHYFSEWSNPATLTVGSASRPVIKTQPASVTKSVGETATFRVEATGATAYQWQYRASASAAWANTSQPGNTTATLSVPVTEARNGFQYRCAVGNSVGITYSGAATLTVSNLRPAITAHPRDVSAAIGSTARFTVEAASSGSALRYQWQYRASASAAWANTSQPGNTTATLSVPVTAARNGFQYRCAVANSAGVVYSTAATLTAVNGPRITHQPVSVTKNVGETARFTVEATGATAYQWQYRTYSGGLWLNTSQSGNTTATLSVPATAARNGYEYRCEVRNSSGTVYSNAAMLTVITGPAIVTHPADRTVNEGANATFTVTANGDSLRYQWQYRTTPTGTWLNTAQSGNTTATLTVPGTAARNGYQYRCEVKNASGTTYSNAATLTVNPVTQTASIGTNSVSVSAGATVKLRFTAPSAGMYRFYSTGSKDTYGQLFNTSGTEIAFNDDSEGAQNRNFLIEKNMNAGETVYVGVRYFLAYETGTISLVIERSAQQQPAISANPVDVNINVGAEAVFRVHAIGAGLSYQWQYRTSSSGNWANTSMNGNTTTTLYVPVVATRNGYQYRCQVKNSYGIVYSNAATLTILNTQTATIGTNPVYVSAGTIVKLRFTAPSAGMYNFYSTGSKDTYGYLYRTTGEEIASNDDAEGEQNRNFLIEKSMNAGETVDIGVRYFDETESGTISVVIAKRTSQIPVIKTNPVSVTTDICEIAEFEVEATGTGLIYQWQYRTSSTGNWANTSLEGNGTSVLQVPSLANRNGYQYRCSVRNSGGTVYSNAATLRIRTAPTARLGTNSVSVEAGATARFLFTAPSAGTYRFYTTGSSDTYGYLYDPTGVEIASNDDDEENSNVNFLIRKSMTAGERVYVGARLYGVVNPGSFTLVIEKEGSLPAITAQPYDASVNEGTNATFRIVASGTGLSYRWQYRTSSTGNWANTGLSGYNTATLTVPATKARNGYQYRCGVTNSAGTVYSEYARLTIVGSTKPVYRALLIGQVHFSFDTAQYNQYSINEMEKVLQYVNENFRINKKVDLNRSAIRNEIVSTFAGATENDVSLFYYSSHGNSSSTDAYVAGALSCSNLGPDERESRLYASELASWLKAVPGKVIVIISSCGSGAFVKDADGAVKMIEAENAFNSAIIEAFSDADPGIITKVSSESDDTDMIDDIEDADEIEKLGDLRVENKFYVITAADYLEYGWAWPKITVLQYYITEGIGKSGRMPADRNRDGKLTLNELHKYIYEEVTPIVFIHPDTGKKYHMHPQVYPENSNFVLFTR